MVAHFVMLSKSFDGYFVPGELTLLVKWIIDPCLYHLDK